MINFLNPKVGHSILIINKILKYLIHREVLFKRKMMNKKIMKGIFFFSIDD